jgi:hypothetical protein
LATNSYKRKDRLWRSFTFEYKVKGKTQDFITLLINPEEFTQAEPARINIIQTKGGAFADFFGQGLKTITIRGVTGFKSILVGQSATAGFTKKRVGDRIIVSSTPILSPTDQAATSPTVNSVKSADTFQPQSGQDHFIKLRRMIRTWQDQSALNADDNKLYFYNWADYEHWEVAVTNFQLSRTVGRPLLYQYIISMTCLKPISSNFAPSFTPEELNLSDPDKRGPLINDRLNDEIITVDSMLNKTTDITKLSPATQSWIGYINGGRQYFDPVASVFSPISSVFSSVKSFSKTLGLWVNGTTSFITAPFELVKGLVGNLNSVIFDMSSVANVPHELVRSFREMMCAINGLSGSLFRGFTNPALFEGESNCGASLGIAPAAVALFNNSFTATAQIAPERQISQIFTVPQQTVVIKEEPDQVVGVFLAADSDRSGDNYLESFSGREIKLTSTPTVPIVVDYKVVQETTTNEIRLQATQAAIINTEDTLERIAFNSYGDASRWKEIMLYNELEYPFIVPIGFQKEIKAIGTIRFTRNPSYSADIIIPTGYKVYVPAFRGTLIIVYTVTASTTLPLNQLFIDVPVECDHVGPIGNVGPGIIKGPYTDDNWATIWTSVKSYLINQLIRPTSSNGFVFKCLIPGVSGATEPFWPNTIGSIVQDGSITWQCFRTDEFEITYYKLTGISSIQNLTSTNGGKIWAVLQPGDLIQIPGTTSVAASLVVGAKKTYDELFGIDLFINTNGELEFGSEGNPDFRRVSGIENLVQALKNRVGTTLKFYVYHPDYGSNLPFYIGRKNDPFWDDLVRVDIRRVCLTDPRISDIESFFMTIDGDTIFVSLDAIPINENSALPVNLII